MAVRYQANRRGMLEMMRTPATQVETRKFGAQVATAAGQSAGAPGGYITSSRQGKTRFRTIVFADSFKAKRREASGNHLLRGLG